MPSAPPTQAWQNRELVGALDAPARAGIADSTCFPASLIAQPDKDLRTQWKIVANDLKKYISTDESIAGSLYHMGVWSERMVGHWALLWRSLLCSEWGSATTPLMARSWFYYLDLSEREYALLALAAFLQPIGLAGDQQFSFDKKEGASLRGAQYLLGIQPYKLANGTPFDLPGLLSKLKLSQTEQGLVAFLVAARALFGDSVKKLFQESQKPDYQPATAIDQTARALLTQLEQLKTTLGLALALDQKALVMIAIVDAAAARGTQPEEGTTSLLFGPACQRLLPPRACHDANAYYRFNYANDKNIGLALKDALVRHVS
jgi:hypothetical protein